MAAAGGGGSAPPRLAAALRHMLPVDEADFDCSIKLQLPEESKEAVAEEAEAEEAEEAEEGRPAKRAKQGGSAAAALVLRASSVALKQHSEMFRRWIQGWAGEGTRTLRIQCSDREEVEAFQSMLAFLHSAGRALPAEPGAILSLLAVARKHAVQTCVDACLQLLLAQVERLPLPACLQLLAILETGTSEDEALQQQADGLQARTAERLCGLVKAEAAAVAADGELQAALASILGRWHGMLNCELRRKVWLALPREVLLVMFEDRHVHADTEATVLAAFAFWADANIASGELSAANRERIAAICSRIRFPDVPPDVLLNYWACFSWLQQYDSSRELMLRALATAAAPAQRAVWQRNLKEPPWPNDQADAAAHAALEQACRLWWTPRAPPLVSETGTATFQLQVPNPKTEPSSLSDVCYWRGYWWCVAVEKLKNGLAAGGVYPACSIKNVDCSQAASSRLLYQTQVGYSLRCNSCGSGAQGTELGTAQGTSAVTPALQLGIRREFSKPSSAPVTWESFWAANPQQGAHLELELSVPPS